MNRITDIQVAAPHQSAPDKQRARAEATAGQFEQLFVRSMVSSLRATSSIDGGGMFGSGPGADTFGDWFDDNLANQVCHTSDIGIKDQLLKDLERHGEIPTAAGETARAAADRSAFTATKALGHGGIDVVL